MMFWDQFSSEDLSKINYFNDCLQTKDQNIFADECRRPSLYAVAQEAGIMMKELPKDCVMSQVLWIKYLEKIRNVLPRERLRYPAIEHFLATYGYMCINESEEEIIKLWETANWMCELFKMVNPRGNKGLAMTTVPKLIEGWEAKYITGSGQKVTTKNRVKIFETEGGIKPYQREKRSTMNTGSEPNSSRQSNSKVEKKSRHYKHKSPTNSNFSSARSVNSSDGHSGFDSTDEDCSTNTFPSPDRRSIQERNSGNGNGSGSGNGGHTTNQNDSNFQNVLAELTRQETDGTVGDLFNQLFKESLSRTNTTAATVGSVAHHSNHTNHSHSHLNTSHIITATTTGAATSSSSSSSSSTFMNPPNTSLSPHTNLSPHSSSSLGPSLNTGPISNNNNNTNNSNMNTIYEDDAMSIPSKPSLARFVSDGDPDFRNKIAMFQSFAQFHTNSANNSLNTTPRDYDSSRSAQSREYAYGVSPRDYYRPRTSPREVSLHIPQPEYTINTTRTSPRDSAYYKPITNNNTTSTNTASSRSYDSYMPPLYIDTHPDPRIVSVSRTPPPPAEREPRVPSLAIGSLRNSQNQSVTDSLGKIVHENKPKIHIPPLNYASLAHHDNQQSHSSSSNMKFVNTNTNPNTTTTTTTTSNIQDHSSSSYGFDTNTALDSARSQASSKFEMLISELETQEPSQLQALHATIYSKLQAAAAASSSSSSAADRGDNDPEFRKQMAILKALQLNATGSSSGSNNNNLGDMSARSQFSLFNNLHFDIGMDDYNGNNNSQPTSAFSSPRLPTAVSPATNMTTTTTATTTNSTNNGHNNGNNSTSLQIPSYVYPSPPSHPSVSTHGSSYNNALYTSQGGLPPPPTSTTTTSTTANTSTNYSHMIPSNESSSPKDYTCMSTSANSPYPLTHLTTSSLTNIPNTNTAHSSYPPIAASGYPHPSVYPSASGPLSTQAPPAIHVPPLSTYHPYSPPIQGHPLTPNILPSPPVSGDRDLNRLNYAPNTSTTTTNSPNNSKYETLISEFVRTKENY